MSLSVSDPQVTVSFYTDKNLLQNPSLSSGIKATGEDRLFSNCFPLAAETGCLWVNSVHIMALIGEQVIQTHQLCMCRIASSARLVLSRKLRHSEQTGTLPSEPPLAEPASQNPPQSSWSKKGIFLLRWRLMFAVPICEELSRRQKSGTKN